MRRKKNNIVNKPKHYTSGSMECIEALKASLPHEQYKGFLRGNVFKYLWRYELKNGFEDLDKARWYFIKLFNEVENETKKRPRKKKAK